MSLEPWKTEGDEFHFEAHGLQCYLIRHPQHKTWLGYVAFPDVAQARSKVLGHSCVPEQDSYGFEVHGGVTFNAYHHQLHQYALGFDTAHFGDYSPGMDQLFKEHGIPRSRDPIAEGDVYRNKEYMISETTLLAQQMADYFRKQIQ